MSSLPISHPSTLASTLAMTAPTHLIFGLLVTSLVGLLAGTPLTPAAFTLAIVGALLPDIDTPHSTIGRVCYPLAAHLERRFGHRSITHSLVGLGIAAALSAILFMFFRGVLRLAPFHTLSRVAWSMFVTGYASHLVADSMTKSGIPLFWPNANIQAVLPGNEAYRIRVGSATEYVFLVVLIPLTAITVPLNRLSLTTALHHVIRNVNSAASDYQAWAGQYQVWVELEGRHNLSQKPVHGTFEAIDTAGQNAIILRDSQGDVYAAGQSRNDEIYVHRIRAIRGIPIRTDIQEIRLDNQPLGDLFSHLAIQRRPEFVEGPSNQPSSQPSIQPTQVWLQGWFVTPQRPLLIDDVGEFNRSKRSQTVAGAGLYQIRYFTPDDLRPLRNIYVTRAHFIVRTVYRADSDR